MLKVFLLLFGSDDHETYLFLLSNLSTIRAFTGKQE